MNLTTGFSGLKKKGTSMDLQSTCLLLDSLGHAFLIFTVH